MDRRLHNNIAALAATGAVLVAALVSASPLSGPATTGEAGMNEPGSGPATLLTALEHAGGPVEAVVEAVDGATTNPKRSTGSEARDRRRIAMPYFTFLPRG